MEIASLLEFRPKAKESISNCGFLTVWEGAVRSSKTIASVYAFFLEVLKSPDTRHLMIGRSQAAVMANCVDSDYGLIDLAGGAAKIRTDKTGETYVDIMGKRIDLFGGEHVSSFKAFRGRTYGMVYIDEVNLQHRNTVIEGFNRTIASRARKHFFTLNPDTPTAWIYTDFIDKYRDQKIEGYRYYHFTLDDNPAISEERKAEIAAQYSGVYYDRYILGKRVRAEGRIYKAFLPSCVNNQAPGPKPYRVTFGLDFGGNKSATVFYAVGWYASAGRLCLHVLAEHYDAENLGVEYLRRDWLDFVRKMQAAGHPLDRAFADSAEQLIIKTLQDCSPIHVANAMKRPINDRIRLADTLFAQGRLTIDPSCRKLIEAFDAAVWDEKSSQESRLDDGSYNVDSLDAFEYAIERDMRELVQGAGAPMRGAE